VTAQQGLAPSLGRTHCMHKGGVEQDEHGARHNVDEHGAEHVVDAKVDVLVAANERHQLVNAS